jgi:hypothetical protein
MSTALATFKLQQTRTGQHPAGVGATLAYNGMIKEVLPPIVRELEEKIAELQKTVEELRKIILETKH